MLDCRTTSFGSHCRKCSDITLKKYKDLRDKNKHKQEKQKWNCLACRTPENPDYCIFNKNMCTIDQLPDSWENIQKGKGKEEEILLHFNGRSIVDKEEELSDIAEIMKPAAIFVTETWFDDSHPKGTSVPANYTIIRKDRSPEYKQKWLSEYLQITIST